MPRWWYCRYAHGDCHTQFRIWHNLMILTFKTAKWLSFNEILCYMSYCELFSSQNRNIRLQNAEIPANSGNCHSIAIRHIAREGNAQAKYPPNMVGNICQLHVVINKPTCVWAETRHFTRAWLAEIRACALAAKKYRSHCVEPRSGLWCVQENVTLANVS